MGDQTNGVKRRAVKRQWFSLSRMHPEGGQKKKKKKRKSHLCLGRVPCLGIGAGTAAALAIVACTSDHPNYVHRLGTSLRRD